ncbi:hypothetical protein BE08_36160, partial [Sorangium cellulosum]
MPYARMMKLAIATGGTDQGRSGLSAYLNAVLPRLRRRVEQAGGATVALGRRADLDAYAAHLRGAERIVTRDAWRPAAL